MIIMIFVVYQFVIISNNQPYYKNNCFLKYFRNEILITIFKFIFVW